MDEEPKKSHKLPSMLEMSEMFDKVQSRIGSLSYNFEKTNSLLGIVSQYEYLNSATSIADLVSKAVQPVGFASINVVDHNALAKCAQLRIPEAIAYNLADTSSLLRMASQYEHLNSAASIANIASKAVQPIDFASDSVVDHNAIAINAQLRVADAMVVRDPFFGMKEGLNAHSNAMSVRDRLIQSMGGRSAYKDIMASANLVRDSVEPYRSAFDTARTLFETSEPFKLARELQSQAFLTNSLSSKYSSVFEQLESLRNLESFKAISRLKNFPNDEIWAQDYDKGHEITEDFLAEVKMIDARISDEISSTDDFNDLTEDTRHDLEEVYFSYYYLIIVSYMYYIFILKEYVIKSIDYSKMQFNFVGSSSSIIVGAYLVGYQPNFNNVLDSIVGGIILMKFAKHLER